MILGDRVMVRVKRPGLASRSFGAAFEMVEHEQADRG
jgi:hypothetical protein